MGQVLVRNYSVFLNTSPFFITSFTFSGLANSSGSRQVLLKQSLSFRAPLKARAWDGSCCSEYVASSDSVAPLDFTGHDLRLQLPGG
jgi:hypothetical protein